jgi:hypothetical protein
MVRRTMRGFAAAAIVAACSAPAPPAPPAPPVTLTRTAGPATAVGELGSKVRVPLPGLAPRAYAEIDTRAVRSAADAGGAARQIDSLCEIWAGEGALVGAISGWTVSGDTARLRSQNLAASVTTTALDDRRVSYEVTAELSFERAMSPR